MCSIDEAWAGQNFAGKRVVSQGDFHKSYMSLPENAFLRNNEFNVIEPKMPQSREQTRGINSQLTQETRLPNIYRSGADYDMNISSVMPPKLSYTGLQPLPAYMSSYGDGPTPNIKDKFNNIENAFNVSDTVNNFMSMGMKNELLEEDTNDERQIINNKFSNLRNNETHMESANGTRMNSNISKKNNRNNEDFDDINNEYLQFQVALQTILSKLNTIETQLNNNSMNMNRNLYDIALYVLIGMLISFIFLSAIRK
jgi:hypothetical protein